MADEYGSEYVAYIPASLLLERGTYHLGVLLRNKTNTTAYDLMLSSSRSQCRYWDTAVETWRGQGCSVGPDTIPSLTHCLCTHLSSFGSTWFVMPNKLNLAEDISKFLTFWENPLTIALVVVLTIIYFLMLVWARRKDKVDQEMIGVFELSDNDPLARHAYLVTVFNGSRRQAGTTSNVTMTLFGLKGKSEPHLLQHANHRMCQTGSVDTVLLRTEEDLGDLTSIRLWHDNSGTSADWFVSHVTVEKMETDDEWVFLCYSWLSVNIGDGVLDKVFPVATGEDLRQFNHLFTSSMSRGLKDSHLYFSIFVRPPTSEFTRVQRLSCCFCLLLCTLLTNIMFFGVEANPEAQGIPDLDFGAFVFNWHSFIISIESALIVLPINILLVEMFRRLRPRQSKNHRLDEKEEEVGHLEAIKAQVQDHKTRLYAYFKDLTKSGECEPEVFLDDLNKIIGDELEVDEQSELLLYTADDLADPDAGGSASLGGDSFNSMRVLRSDDFMSDGGASGADVQPSRRQIDEVRQKAESESASQVGDIKSQDRPSEPREDLKTPRLLPSNLNENSNAWLKKAANIANMKPLTYKRTEAISFNRQKTKAQSRSSNRRQTEARLTSFDKQQTEARLTSFNRQQTEARLTSFDRQQTEARLTSFDRQQTEARLTSFDRQQTEDRLTSFDRQQTEARLTSFDRQQTVHRSAPSDKQQTAAPPTSSEDENEAFHELADKLSKCRQVLISYLSTELAYQTQDVADLLEGTFEHSVNLDHDEGEINEEENVYKAGRTRKNPLHGVSDYLLHVQEAKHIVKEKAIILELDDTDDVTGLARIQRCCRWDGMLPWWFVYIAWILLFLAAVSAAFFTMLYGLNYGKEKSWNWLLTVLETMFMDILCLQPLKILVLALFFAVVLKRGRDEVFVRARQLTDWKWKPLKSLESNWLFYHRQHLQEMRHSDPKYRPPPEADVLKARQHHHQQKRMMAILKEIIGYVTYIWVILLIAYAQRDPQSYYLGDFVGKTVFGSSFTEIKDFPSAWEWLNTTIVDSLYPNTRPGFLMGESLYIVGQPQLRQVRALTSSCSSFGDIVVGVCRRDAVGGYTEDTSAYNLTWSCPVDRSPAVISKCSSPVNGSADISKLPRSVVEFSLVNGSADVSKLPRSVVEFSLVNGSADVSKLPRSVVEFKVYCFFPCDCNTDVLLFQFLISRLQTAYIYQTGDTLRSLPLLGQVFSFSGGGYIVRLGSTGNDARQVLRDLHRQLWLDKNSIAILLEFTVYSANTNLFLVVTGVLEFPDAGSAVVSSIRQPIRLYRYTTPVHVVVLACEIFYCAFMIAFIVAAILNIRREKWQYFHSYWNWLQVTIILVSIATIVVYILRSVETTRLLHQYKNDQTQFLSFAHSAFLDSILGYLIAFLVVLGTLKFLHLLRFNPQIFYFLQTLNTSLATLKFHLLSLLILWFAYSGFGAMMFGRHVREYSSLAQALMNLFNLAYGRIDEQYRDLAVVDVNTARFFLFSFVIVSNYLIFNIMISSILYFYDAVMTKGAPNEDTELLLLMLQRIGEFLGLKFFKAKDDKKAKK
ncbi:polycystin-1-like protein 2 [Lineus longissimus]|uniref:polycystin-1-like protein 2 n=1 Tax=Lineus longissimus TaxID=88925 RepID=UPI00315D651A